MNELELEFKIAEFLFNNLGFNNSEVMLALGIIKSNGNLADGILEVFKARDKPEPPEED